MRRYCSVLIAIGAISLLAVPASASAQSGLSLRGHLVYNASTAKTFRDEPDSSLGSEFSGFNVGAEFALPLNLGIGVSGSASGDPRDTDRATVFIVLAEANYYLNLPALPIRPFAGAHIGLGSWSWDVKDGLPDGDASSDLERAKLGWQLGIDVDLPGPLGLEAMYRSMSASAEEAQDAGFESRQLLLGIRVF